MLMKSEGMGWEARLARVRRMQNAYNVLNEVWKEVTTWEAQA
jgi:hypothetical protein